MSLSSLDWGLCRSFLAILRSGSLTGAARALGVTHPTIRRHLEDMEREFGTPLFVRSPSGLVATELALTLRDPAEAMEAAFEQMVRHATDTGREVSGTVRITATEIIGIEVLPPILESLREVHPGLVFELDITDQVVDVLRNDADIAVRMLRPTQSELLTRRAAKVELGLFAHRRWLSVHGEPTSLEELIRDRQLIGYDHETRLIEGLAAKGLNVHRRDFGYRSDNSLAQLAALRAGLGAAIAQVPLAARDSALIRLFPEISGELEIWTVCHPNLRSSPRLRACLDALAEGLAAYANHRISDCLSGR
jgi:DNA-binding transcriptional LysR family regulator